MKKLNPEVQTPSVLPRKSQVAIVSSPYEQIDLDVGQIRALKVILTSIPDLPILVAGPFGTGKTRLLARASYEILKEKNARVLICAHHQASVDTFVEKYFGPMIENKDNPWVINFLRVIPNNSYRSKTRRKYEGFFKASNSLSSNDLIRNRVIITTLGIAQKLFHYLPSDKKRSFFTHILIDEGAQTREPETVGPLCLAGRNTRIVVTGDHLQVRLYCHSNNSVAVIINSMLRLVRDCLLWERFPR